MSSSSDGFTCQTHGNAYPTFLCRHLGKRPRQRWYGKYPSKNDPWPDAWCAKCEEAEELTANQFVVVCHQCYEDALSVGSTYLSSDARKAWLALLKESHAYLHEKQDRLMQE